MEQYRMDFAMQRGHEMLLDREQGIVREELDELEISMLQAAEVPRLLKMEWYDLDGHITFRYTLAGKRMLSQRLQTGVFTMRHYYQLMLSIVQALEDCKHYMLRSEAILLHEHYMYVGNSWQDIGLAYMPLRQEPDRPVRERLTGLAVRWTVHIEHVDGIGLQRMLRELGNDSGDWTAIRELLLELIALSAMPQAAAASQRHSAESEPQLQVQERARHRSAAVQTTVAPPLPTSQEKPLRPSAPSPPAVVAPTPFEQRKPVSLAAASADVNVPALMEDEQEAEGSRSRKTIVIGAIVVVASALVWRYGYIDTPTTQRAMLCGGLTLLATAAGYWGWRSADRSEEMEENEEAAALQDIQEYEEEQSAWRWGGWERKQEEPNENNTVVDSLPSVAARPPAVPAATWEAPESAAYPPPIPDTAAPTFSSEETVLLGAHSDPRQPGERDGAYLERLWEGRAERVPLSGGRFVIGRSGENSHYVDSSSGLSRSHLEILKENKGFAVKDLGSRNGSLLNGESMIPYKHYSIQSGDQLQLAGSHGAVYTFQKT